MARLIASNQLTLTNVNDGIAGKDGVGIVSTAITYAASSSGTTAPTSGWSTSVPAVSSGQYLWTKTVWTYTDNTSETGYSVARMGADGSDASINITCGFTQGYADSFTPMNKGIGSITPLSDGWARVLYTNTTSAVQRVEFSLPKPEGLTENQLYTFLLEFRNNKSSFRGVAYFVQDNRSAFWGNLNNTAAAYIDQNLVRFSRVPQTNTISLSEATCLAVVNITSSPNQVLDVEFRISAYVGDYKGAYIPYMGGKVGPRGNDGNNAYIHFAFSDNANGVPFSHTDTGQRYQGYYSDNTQAHSGDANRYTWNDRWAKIDIGTDNLLVNTASLENNIQKSIVNTLDKYNGGTIAKGVAPGGSYRDIFRQTMKTAPLGNVFIGSFYAKSTLDGHRINCYFFSPNRTIQAMSSDGYTWSNAIGGDGLTSISLSTEWKRYWVVWTIRDATLEAENVPMTVIFCRNNDSVNEVSLALPALYVGNINKEHSLAQEDIQADIDSKADQALTQEQINALNEKNQILETEMQAKASMEAFSEFEKAYQSFVKSNAEGQAKAEADLIEAGRRIELLTTQFGGFAELKTFIDTYMSSSNEGLVIGKNDASSTIKVSSDRISMFSAGKEVVYISQGVINIDNGIFTVSIQIGKFRTEQYELNADMNVIRYVG